jgi:hypothetical protein
MKHKLDFLKLLAKLTRLRKLKIEPPPNPYKVGTPLDEGQTRNMLTSLVRVLTDRPQSPLEEINATIKTYFDRVTR